MLVKCRSDGQCQQFAPLLDCFGVCEPDFASQHCLVKDRFACREIVCRKLREVGPMDRRPGICAVLRADFADTKPSATTDSHLSLRRCWIESLDDRVLENIFARVDGGGTQ